MIVSEARYRTLTRDVATASAPITAALDLAQTMLEETLGRPLEQDERTGTFPIWRGIDGRGRVNPDAYPITAAAGTYEIEDQATLVGVEPDQSPWFGAASDHLTATVTWTGGWVPHGDPSGDRVIPPTLERAICDLAAALLTVTPGPGGPITAATVGDVSVTYAEPTGDDDVDRYVPGLADRIGRYRHRTGG